MAENSKIQKVADLLWKEQNEKNWKSFASALKTSKIKYYKVVFANQGKLSKMQDLTKSFVLLFDAKYKPVTRVPAINIEKKKVRGATIYLMGLKVLNRD